MLNLLKTLSSKLPISLQQELKKYHYWIQIRKGAFVSDEPEFDLLKDMVVEGDWVIDIGANVGHYSCALAKLVGKNGRVISFEPSPRNFELLTANLNKLGLDNFTPLNFAASSSWEVVGMEIPKFSTGLTNYYMAKVSKEADSNKVICSPIDAFDFDKPIKLIKIDVEGHELSALRGMKSTLERYHPILIVEGDDPEVNSFLASFGYKEERLKNSPNILFKT